MLFATSGAKFMIGASRGMALDHAMTLQDFASDPWLEVAHLTSLGRLSGQWETDTDISPDVDDAPSAYVTKVARPARSLQIVTLLSESDPGQLAMIKAEDSLDDAFGFRLDLPNGASRLFVALVIGLDQVFDEANSALSLSFTLALQSNVVHAATNAL